MKIYLADSFRNHSKIDFISQEVGLYQEPIRTKPFKEAKSIDLADAILVPHDAYHFSKYPEYLEYLNKLSKSKLVIFSDRGDFPKRPLITNSIALRVAIDPYEKTANKIVIPYNIQYLSNLPKRKYQANPQISFMGYMPTISPARILKSFRHSGAHPVIGNGAIVRRIAHKRLKTTNLNYKYTLRNTYGALNLEDKNLSLQRKEYLAMLSNSDIVLAPRGDANQSARFFEILSAGRIPLIPKSEIALPFSASVELTKNLLPFGLIRDNLEITIQEFWESLFSNERYIQLQDGIRDFYASHFRFENCIKSLFVLNTNEFIELSQQSKIII